MKQMENLTHLRTNGERAGADGNPQHPCVSFSFKIHGDGHRHPGIMNHSSHKKFLQQKEIREIQEKKMGELLAYLKSNSPYYQKIFKQHKIDPEEFRQLEDLSNNSNNRKGRSAIIQ